MLNDESNSWDVLYKNTLKKKENEKLLKEERKRLTNMTSDNLTQSDILYATNDELKNKIAMNKGSANDNALLSPDVIKKTRDFILGKEGFKTTAYKPTPNDVWTIGYGHTNGVKKGDKITKEQAELLYEQDLKNYANSLKCIKTKL